MGPEKRKKLMIGAVKNFYPGLSIFTTAGTGFAGSLSLPEIDVRYR
jgi:hypothetical protein